MKWSLDWMRIIFYNRCTKLHQQCNILCTYMVCTWYTKLIQNSRSDWISSVMLARIEICKHSIYFHLIYLFTLLYRFQNVQMMYLGCFQRVHVLNITTFCFKLKTTDWLFQQYWKMRECFLFFNSFSLPSLLISWSSSNL